MVARTTVAARGETGDYDMPNLGAPELIIIALVILLLFGATRLPKLGRSMGRASTNRASTTTRTTTDRGREARDGRGQGRQGF
jgi:TatA/E family protein of Tat protein translocase